MLEADRQGGILMKFFDRIRASFASFMSGRYGIDQLSHHMVIAALVMTVIGALT